MKILACVKLVREAEGELRPDPATGLLLEGSAVSYRMSELDGFALEQALRIRESRPGSAVEAVTVGPERAAQVLKRALGMGADHGVHIRTASLFPPSPFEAAAWLGQYAAGQTCDLILAGMMSEDLMQGLVGPLLAERLGWPCVTCAILVRVAPDGGSVYVEREIEQGWRERLSLRLPAVLTVQSGAHKPRYPALSAMLRARRTAFTTLEADSLGRPEARQDTVRVFAPGRTRAGLFLEGSTEQKALELLRVLALRGLAPRAKPAGFDPAGESRAQGSGRGGGSAGAAGEP